MGARLGQHFLTARWAAVSLARAVNVQQEETILEIGPGKGALTRELLATGPRVVAIEKDELLVEMLGEKFAKEIAEGRLRIITDDIRNIDIAQTIVGNYVVAANIPYYITGEIIRQFLTTTHQPRAMALLIQKEVAQRITSKKKASLLSLSVQAYGTVKIVEKVSKKCFSPAPSVDSAILLIDTISRDFFSTLDEAHFFAVLHAGFASKRKFLVSNLGLKFDKERVRQIFVEYSINEKVRAEDIALDQWKIIAEKLV